MNLNDLKRRLTVTAVLAALLLGLAPAAIATEATTYTEALELASRVGKPIVIDFYTDW